MAVSGDRRSGYVRLKGTGSIECQLRWQPWKSESVRSHHLHNYFRLLQRDARNLGKDLVHECEEVGPEVTFKWVAERCAMGFARYGARSKRLFILEWSGSKRSALATYLREARETFQCYDGKEREPWSMGGLSIWLPAALLVKSQVLQTGKTQIHWVDRGVVVSASRSAFGKEILQKMSLEEWARTLAPKGSVEALGDGVRIVSQRRKLLKTIRSVSLARWREEENQLEFVSAMFDRDEWEPQWDWFESQTS